MEVLLAILAFAAIIYYRGKNKGFKEGKKKGAEAAYGAGLLEGASKVTVKDKGCLVLVLALAGLSVFTLIVIAGI